MTSDSVHRLVIADEETPDADDRYRPDEQTQADLHIQVREILLYQSICSCILEALLTADIWLKYCRYDVKYYPINQSIN